MSITTAVLARDAARYTAKLDSYLLSLRNACANEEAYEAALEMAKYRAKEFSLTLIEAVQLIRKEIRNHHQSN